MQHEIVHKTARRTPAEKRTADEIDKLKPVVDLIAERQAARLVAAAKRSSRYEFNRGYSSIDEAPIRYFYHKDESITGIIGPAQPETFMECTFPIKGEDGRITRIVAHRRLRQVVEMGKYIGRNVTIVYKGRLLTKWGGHCEKLYEVHAAGEPPVSTEAPAGSMGAENERAARQRAEETRQTRRDFYKEVVARNRVITSAKTLKGLKEFTGEAWADQAIARAKEGK
jgi:hypothetical protein